jgi:hypothetical protein
MASSTGRLSARQTAGCAVVIVLGIVLIGGLVWFGPRLVFGPSLWKTTIATVKIPSRRSLDVGRSHDGDISYEYFVRVRGADGQLAEWRYLAWSLDPIEHTETALSSDSRYAAVSFDTTDGNVLVIYDSVSEELWWNADDQWESTTKFLSAWRQLHTVNPKLSAPP